MKSLPGLRHAFLIAVMLDKLPAENIVATNPELMLIDEPFMEEQYAILINKGENDFFAVINSVIGKLKEEGKIAEWTEMHAQEVAA